MSDICALAECSIPLPLIGCSHGTPSIRSAQVILRSFQRASFCSTASSSSAHSKMQIPPLPGNRRHLLQYTFTGVQKELREMGPSTSRNPCSNGQNSVQCPSASSTVFIVVLGLSTMMIVVLITIVLLCRSLYAYRQIVEHRQQQRLREEGNRAAVVPVIEVPGSSDNMVLVLLPGEKEPVACALLSPLHSESEEPISSEKHVSLPDTRSGA